MSRAYSVLKPRHIPTDPNAFRKREEDGFYNLSHGEILWRDRYEVLLKHGYKLRPRFRPNWTPSWKQNGLDPTLCEDSLRHFIEPIMDATRISDGVTVAIKTAKVDARKFEGSILEHFSQPQKAANPRNHCVPLYDRFRDERVPDAEFLVMPMLRPFDDPEFFAVGEVVDFVQQTLQGLVFMHKEGIAHLNCSMWNIMMDASPLYPEGFHPSVNYLDPTGMGKARHRIRIDSPPVKYYFVDFQLSRYLDMNGHCLRIGAQGDDDDIPELRKTRTTYEATPVDVRALGNVYKKNLIDRYSNLEFLRPLVDAMRRDDPDSRPSATKAYDQFKALISGKSGPTLRWRLHSREETTWHRARRHPVCHSGVFSRDKRIFELP